MWLSFYWVREEANPLNLDAAGGLAVVLARSVRRVLGVHKLAEFGVPEATWVIEVERFPATVAMDTHGESVYRRVEEASAARLRELLQVRK